MLKEYAAIHTIESPIGNSIDKRIEDIEAMLSDIVYSDVYKIFPEVRTMELENSLHERLSRAVDIRDAVEAFSVWLTHEVHHDLVGLMDVLDKKWSFICSHHGSKHSMLIKVAQEAALMDSDREDEIRGYHFKKFSLKTSRGKIVLIVLREGSPFLKEDLKVMEIGIKILSSTIERVIYFETLYMQSRVDTLTGLSNRRVFEERIVELMANSKRYKLSLSIALLDLDHFKDINDTLGHDTGDKTLRKVAEIFKKGSRDTDLVARLGGDEFVIVMPNTRLDDAKILAQRIINDIEDLTIKTPNGKRLGISIGLSQWDGRSSKEDWLKFTDELLYEAKRSGRNCYVSSETIELAS